MQPITFSSSDASVAAVYSRPVRMDSWANAQSVIQVKVTGTVTWTIQTSMDDPNSPTHPVAEGSMVWSDALDANLVDETSNKSGIFNLTPIFVRIKQIDGSGSVTATISQFGNATY